MKNETHKPHHPSMIRQLLISCAPILAFTLHSAADTILLKDGTQIDGRILSQDDQNYVIEVQVTRSIKDEKTIPKSDVVKVEQETPDLKDFAQIAALIPVPDMLAADQYNARVKVVEKFLNQYPASSKAAQAKSILKTLKDEANEILAGGIKIGGNIIPPAEYRSNALEIDARGQEAIIRGLIQKSDDLAALRAFLSFERDFKGTASHTALLPLISQALTRYTSEVQAMLAGYPQRIKDREAGLTRMQVDDRRTTQAAIAEELALAERQFKAEKDARIGWVTLQPYVKSTMDETLNFGKQEATRIQSSIRQAPADTGKAYREALLAIQSASEPGARNTALAQARSAGLSPKYLALLEAAAKP
jgi:hypothetical protein